MKLRNFTIGLLLTGIAATAQAHTHLESSLPSDKSKVKAPANVELHFSEAARVTAMSLQKGTEAAVALKPLPAKAMQHVSVPVPALSAGDYIVNWRVVGDDGHVMSGKFGFTVDPSAPEAKTATEHAHMNHDDHAGDKKAGTTSDAHKH